MNTLLKIFIGLFFTFIFSFQIYSENISGNRHNSSSESVSRLGINSAEYLRMRGLILFNNGEWKQAEKYFNVYREKFSKKDEVVNRYLAQISIIEGDLEKAEDYLLEGLENNSNSEESLLLLASIAENKNDHDTAIIYYEKILEINPYHEEAIFSLAQLYLYNTKDIHHAIGFYKRLAVAIQHNGSSSYKLMQVYNTLGGYYAQKKDYKRANIYFLKIEELDSQNIPILFAIGQLYKLSGDVNKSIEYMQKIQKLNFRNIPSLFSLAESYYMLDKPAAKAFADAYVRRTGKNADALITGIAHEIENKDKEALKDFENMKKIAAGIGRINIYKKENSFDKVKSEAYTVVLMARQLHADSLARDYSQIVFSILEKEKQEQNFKKHFFYDSPQKLEKPILRNAIDSVELYSLYAQILSDLNEPKASLAYFQQSNYYLNRLAEILKSSPSIFTEKENLDFDASLESLNQKKYNHYLKMSLLYNDLDEYKQIDLILEKARQLYPENPQTYFFKGLLLQHEACKKKEESLYKDSHKFLNQSIEISKEKNFNIDSSLYFYRGISADYAYGFERALPDFKKALEMDSDNPQYLNYLGYLYSQNNRDLKKARSLLIRALDDDLENYAYLDSLGWIFYKQKEYHHALRNLLMAEFYADKENIKDPVLYFHLAETYNRLENYPMANINYQKSLEYINDSSEELDVEYINKMLQNIKEKSNEK